MTARGKLWGYRITTGFFCLGILPGGFMGLAPVQAAAELFTHLGYPIFLCRLLSVWKLLGVAALLTPGRPRLKEWAYAGFVFDLTSATISYVAIGDPIANALGPLGFLAFLTASYLLRPANDSML
jgi:DoxX-like protein